MIYLQEVAEKLNAILNGTDTETSGHNNPTDFLFMVETQGYHLDLVYDLKEKKNRIPVFLSTMGGSINPVPSLKQINLNIPVAFYFPVRFKNEIFELFDFLVDVFSGQILHYGKTEKRALSNLSVPTYGEIQNMDLKAFNDWVNDNYGLPIDIYEPYLSMQFTLYLQTANEEFIYGNSVKLTNITITDDNGTDILDEDDPVLIERVDMESSESAAQQLFSNTHAKGYPANAAYSKQLPLILKNNTQYKNLLDILENTKNPQSLTVTLTESIPFVEADGDSDPLEIETTYYISNYSRKVTLGELVGIQLTLSIRGDVN